MKHSCVNTGIPTEYLWYLIEIISILLCEDILINGQFTILLEQDGPTKHQKIRFVSPPVEPAKRTPFARSCDLISSWLENVT